MQVAGSTVLTAGPAAACPCVDCGGLFTALVGRGRPRKRCEDCSPRQLGQPSGYVANQSEKRTCAAPECCATFVTTYPHARYCSRRCGNRSTNVSRQAAARDRSARPCGFCGTEFAPAYGDKRKRFCGATCSRSWTYRERTGSTHRRRARKFGVEIQPVNKVSIFERDRWTCQLCGRKTPAALRGTNDPRAPELDHIVPLSKGGAHAPGNCQCACRACNRAKSDNPRGQMLLALT